MSILLRRLPSKTGGTEAAIVGRALSRDGPADVAESAAGAGTGTDATVGVAVSAGSSKLTLTIRVLTALSIAKYQFSTDCWAARRSSIGPLSTRVSTTLPRPSRVASTVTTPCTRLARADSGYAIAVRCIMAPPVSTMTPGPSATIWGAAAKGNVAVTNQHARARIPNPAASEEIDLVLDIRTSFIMDRTRCFKCRLRRKSGI